MLKILFNHGWISGIELHSHIKQLNIHTQKFISWTYASQLEEVIQKVQYKKKYSNTKNPFVCFRSFKLTMLIAVICGGKIVWHILSHFTSTNWMLTEPGYMYCTCTKYTGYYIHIIYRACIWTHKMTHTKY